MPSEWPAIIGTLSGTGIGAISAWALERARWKRQRIDRWAEARRVMYAGFVSEIDDDIKLLYRNAASVDELQEFRKHIREAERSVSVPEIEAAVGHVNARLDEMLAVHEVSKAKFDLRAAELSNRVIEISLVATKPVLTAASAVLEAAKSLNTASTGGTNTDSWKPATDGVAQCRFKFINACRKELSVGPL